MYGRIKTKRQEKAEAGHYKIEPYDSRFYAVRDSRNGELVGVFVYLKGAAYVARKLTDLESAISQAAGLAATIEEVRTA